jgi:N-acetylmuramoyl-L-alanine amidase
MTRYPPPDPPWEGPAAHDSGPQSEPFSRVVIHSTVSPCEPGGRHDIAAYFRSPASGGSAHYVCDPVGVVQCVRDHVVAWHAPPNPRTLGIEMCDIPGPVPGDGRIPALLKAARRTWRWRRPNQQAMLHVTAQLTAQLCLAYDLPAVWLGPRRLKAGHRGVTSHNNVSRTWHQSTHWDPGFWPRRRFMRLVREYIATEKRGHH